MTLSAVLPWLSKVPSGELIVPEKSETTARLLDLTPQFGLGRLLLCRNAQALKSQLLSELSQLQMLSNEKAPLYVFGAKLNATKMLRYCAELGIPVAGLIDNDSKKQARLFDGFRVYALQDVPKDAFIINASGRYAVEIGNQLHTEGYVNAWNMTQFLFVHDLPFQAHSGFRDFVTEVVLRQVDYLDLYLRLADAKLCRALDAILDFRLTLSEASLFGTVSPYDEEFFDQGILKLGRTESYVDGGAYDGDSFARFSTLSPDFTTAYLYEPDPSILGRARDTLGNDPRIHYRQAGLYSETATLYFSSTGAMDGALTANEPDSGEFAEIPVVTIDTDVSGPVSFIKLDIEGAEAAALQGAAQTIAVHGPKLAIASYHKPSDLVDIPSQVAAMGQSYNVYLRHYSQTLDDSVLYFTPSDIRIE